MRNWPFQSHTRSMWAFVGIESSRCCTRVKNTQSIESIRLMVNIARTVRFISERDSTVSMVAAAEASRLPCVL